MTSWSILGHTAKVLEERRDDYGDPADQFKAIAARWSITLDTPVTPAQVALCTARPVPASPVYRA